MKLSTPSSSKGFTLIEMIVVIIIIGVVTVFSIPHFGGFANRTKLESACRQWMAYANYARSQAVLEGVNYRLTCDLDQQQYYLSYELSTTNVAGEYVSPADPWGETVSLDSSIQMSSILMDQNLPKETGIVTIVFTPHGTANDVQIDFQNHDQETRQVILTGVTGLAKIQSIDTAT